MTLATNNERGGTYTSISSQTINVRVGGGAVRWDDNSFKHNPFLGELINRMINMNFHTFIAERVPLMQSALETHLKAMTNKFFNTYTKDQLFPN